MNQFNQMIVRAATGTIDVDFDASVFSVDLRNHLSLVVAAYESNQWDSDLVCIIRFGLQNSKDRRGHMFDC